MYNYDLGNPSILRQQFLDTCSNERCDKAATSLLNFLSGQYENNNCDFLQAVYDAYPEKGWYSGNREQVLNIGAFMFELAVIGVTVQGGY